MTLIENYLENFIYNTDFKGFNFPIVAINPRFITYFHDTFFDGKEDEFELFLSSLEKSIPRTIRIKPGKVHEVKKRLEAYWFILGETSISNVFTLDRSENFDPLERRIGFTPDHLIGNFYIQELAAATSVHILTDGKVHEEALVILDMASSPGGKTTQLSEHYPNAFIIANEPTRERIPQLLQNLDRMWSPNIGVTLYPGQYFRHSREKFDRILLDAPCSGEGTLYKWTEATKHWHLKNIKNIANLQIKLLDAAILALKIWWEMVYSTCSMNLVENEGVLEAIMKKYPQSFEILYQKRFWPHRDGTGWFFVAKIRKIKTIETVEKSRKETPNNKIERLVRSDIDNQLNAWITLYKHDGKVLALKNHPALEELRENYYFMRFGERIGFIDSWKTLLWPFSHRFLDLKAIPKYEIKDEKEIDFYLRGGSIDIEKFEWPILLTYQWITLALEEVANWNCSNNFPRDWQRK